MINPKKYLRTFDKIHPPLFQPDEGYDKTKSAFGDLSPNRTSKTFFTVSNILTEKECDQLVSCTNDRYESLESEFVKGERDGYRFLSKDDILANTLFDRLKPFIMMDPHIDTVRPVGFGVKGKWIPNKLNNCFRYNRYISPSIGFKPHRDATFIENVGSRSVFTILIYLNDDFEGGDTTFYKTFNKRTNKQTVSDEMSSGYKVRYRFRPKKGSVLVFNHNMIHEGESLTSGTKYIIRSDIVFQNIDPPKSLYWLDNRDFIKAVKIFREAMNQELDGNLEKASLLYQHELAIRQMNRE